MTIDMWYGDDVKNADEVTFTFYDRDGEYRGTIYSAGKAIGDYRANSRLEIEKTFPWMKLECSGNPLYNNYLVG